MSPALLTVEHLFVVVVRAYGRHERNSTTVYQRHQNGQEMRGHRTESSNEITREIAHICSAGPKLLITPGRRGMRVRYSLNNSPLLLSMASLSSIPNPSSLAPGLHLATPNAMPLGIARSKHPFLPPGEQRRCNKKKLASHAKTVRRNVSQMRTWKLCGLSIIGRCRLSSDATSGVNQRELGITVLQHQKHGITFSYNFKT